ncbi:hypothetical protein RRF57_004747 [Xylaria bambusicola]|uniref:ATPase AAA-type core domain-containing protein n=1 Tax=Xylaria bambusicola TaxID=326684 RepID=A0AAN7Z4L8_9PEZI
MVLTTNRTTAIDPAFESRIDIMLTFDDLTTDAKKEIWCNFLESLEPQPLINDQEVRELAEYPLNGRQIKSAIKTATILATSEGCPVMLRHLKIVLNLRQKAIKLMGPAGLPTTEKIQSQA